MPEPPPAESPTAVISPSSTATSPGTRRPSTSAASTPNLTRTTLPGSWAMAHSDASAQRESSPSPLPRPCGARRHQVLAREHEDDRDRQRVEHARRHHRRPVDVAAADEALQHERHRLLGLVIEERQRQQELLPALEEAEDRGRGEARRRQR